LAKVTVKLAVRLRQAYERINLNYLRGEFRHLGAHAHIEFPTTIMNPQCISIGDNFTARAGVKLRAYTSFAGVDHSPDLSIGNNVHLAADCTINCTHRVTIGDNSGLGVGSKVMDHMHGLPGFEDLGTTIMERILTSRGPVIIGENVMLGAGVVVLAGVEIGRNSVIGSNAVVTKSIPANSIAVGIPARVIKTIQVPEEGV